MCSHPSDQNGLWTLSLSISFSSQSSCDGSLVIEPWPCQNQWQNSLSHSSCVPCALRTSLSILRVMQRFQEANKKASQKSPRIRGTSLKQKVFLPTKRSHLKFILLELCQARKKNQKTLSEGTDKACGKCGKMTTKCILFSLCGVREHCS